MKLVFLVLALLTTSCANYINKIHRDLDRQDQQQENFQKRKKDLTFSQFRDPKYKSNIDTASQKNLLPRTKRLYSNKPERVKADDLTDNGSTASLWSGSGNDNYLFTKYRWKRNGDIVLLKVKKDMKNEITLELKRAFPVMPKKMPKPDTANNTATAAQTAPTPPAQGEAEVKEEKVYDKISSVVIEEISKDHLLIRGQKFLLFRNRKHLVEVQALVARKDIMDDDTVDSSQVLESTVTILR